MPKPRRRPWPGAVLGHPSCGSSPCSCCSTWAVSAGSILSRATGTASPAAGAPRGSPPIVPLGSAVTASCTVQRELCQGLEQGRVRISWMLDNKPVAGSQRQGPGGTEVSNLTLPRFNHTQARLFCCVEWNGTKQRVGMAEIRAGYPPAKPLNLSCVLNLDDYGLTCQWQQGTNSHLPTSFVLKSQAVTGCTPRGGHSHCTVPRRLLQLYRQMEIWVSATNALGTAESEHLLIDPMDVVLPAAPLTWPSVPPQCAGWRYQESLYPPQRGSGSFEGPCQQVGALCLTNSPCVSPGATVNPSLSSFAIRGLKPSTLYKVHIMASTAAGSTNGTSLILVTTVLGEGCSHPTRGTREGTWSCPASWHSTAGSAHCSSL
uniref:Ig-like domain-containing protein n=1 Tax=Zonotrichia albicollis TaxID=44394 RepID=A0A8D2MWD8_ZONAL